MTPETIATMEPQQPLVGSDPDRHGEVVDDDHAFGGDDAWGDRSLVASWFGMEELP